MSPTEAAILDLLERVQRLEKIECERAVLLLAREVYSEHQGHVMTRRGADNTAPSLTEQRLKGPSE